MQIKELLAKHILGLLTAEEKEQLRQWLEEDPANRDYFQQLQSRHNYSARYQAYQAKRQQARTIRLKRWGHIASRAAIWTLPLILAMGLWIGLRPSKPSEDIQPGEAHAILYLSNGEAISLGNSKELGWIHIENNLTAANANGALSYHTTEEAALQHQQNRLVTPRGGEYRLTLPDGTKVHLNAQSELVYPLAFEANQRTVELKGEAYFEVAKDAQRPFYVKAHGLTIRQYGTQFNVKARLPQPVNVALDEGSVGILAPGGNMQMLEPGQLATWDGTSSTARLAFTDLEPHTAWHHGRFAFDNATLAFIMEELSLWYDVDVRFQGHELEELHFTGNLNRYEDIHVILRGIESIVNVECQIKGKQIYIIRKQ